MTQKTNAQITTELNAEITTNGVGAITGAILNGVLNDLNDSKVITNIPGLPTMLQNGNWQLICGSRNNMGNSSGFGTSAVGYTSRLNYIPVVSATHIVLVFGNWNSNNSLGENPGNCTVRVEATLEYFSTSASSETGARIPVYFKGQRYVDVPPTGIIYSDPITFNTVAGTPFFVRSYVCEPGTGYVMPAGSATYGGTGAGGVNNGDGTFPGPARIDGVNSVTQTAFSNAYSPCAVLGFTASYVPSIGIIGDSICAGTSDGGYSNTDGGYLVRAVSNQLSLTYQYPVTPLVPFTRSARGGETLQNFVTISNSVYGSGGLKRTELAQLASTIGTEYGTNDLGGQTLLQMQTNYLALANTFLSRGKYFIASTLLPRTTSTDGFITTANQTLTANEAVRIGFNTWLRNTSVTGFAAQTGYAAFVSIFDGAAAVEVNASNVPTQNGGFWLIAPGGGTPIVTGTATSGTGSQLINDTTKAFTQDQYKGYVLRMTSGAANNINTTIYANTPTALSTLSISPAPASGDTYQIYQSYTIDGTHPTSLGHMTIAATFPIGLIQ